MFTYIIQLIQIWLSLFNKKIWKNTLVKGIKVEKLSGKFSILSVHFQIDSSQLFLTLAQRFLNSGKQTNRVEKRSWEFLQKSLIMI